jgi:alpha-glucosidase (family GH31 glycosyl hydrolase)
MQQCTDIATFSSQSYFLGPNIYVVPVQRDPAPGQNQRLWLPRSSTKQWINYFNTSITHPQDRYISEDTSTLDRIPVYIEQNSLIPMYDLEKSPSLNAYRFVLWGKVILDKKKQQPYLHVMDNNGQ